MPLHLARRAACVVALVTLSGLGACGKRGGSSPTAPAPVPAPPNPVTTTVREGSFTGLDPDFLLVVPFNLTVAGDLEAVADWTFASNDLDLFLTRGTNPCDNGNNQIDFDLCTILVAETGATTKPERLRAPGLTTGAYTLYIGNAGPDRESLSYLIMLTYTPRAGAPAGVSALRPTVEPFAVSGRPWR